MKYPDLNGLTVCRALLDDPVISKLAEMQESCNEKQKTGMKLWLLTKATWPTG